MIVGWRLVRDYSKESWLEHLGDYPEEFCHWLDFRCCDLDNQDSLQILHDESVDTTYFLSVPPERYENAVINLKEAGFLDDPDHQGGYRKTLGYDLKSAIIYSLWFTTSTRKTSISPLTIILVKILSTIF